MIYAKPLIPALLVLMLVAVGSLKKRADLPRPLASTALGRLGFGFAKLCLLVLPLEWLLHLFLNADPLAVSPKAVWLAALAQSCQLLLAVTGMADVVTGIAGLLGMAVEEPHAAACRAGSFSGLWRRLMPGMISGGKVNAMQCVPVLVLVAGVSALWHGTVQGVSVWFVIHYLLLMAEGARRKPLFSPLPLPVQVILVLLILLLSSVLLLAPNSAAALESWKLMFSEVKPTVYSLLMNKRLTSSWLQWVVFISMLTCVALPRLGWLLELPIITWRIIGTVLILPSLLLLVREVRALPDSIRQAAQWPVTWLFNEGNTRVHVGYDGWLYPHRELDRRTLKRAGQQGLTEPLLELATELKSRNIPLMLVAAPAKMALYPENVLRAEYAAPVQPPGHKARLEKLSAAGIDVVDPAPALWERLLKAESHYMADSHWTFETMKEVAGAVARRIREKHPQLYVAETPVINATILERSEAGDLARDLLPQGSDFLFPAEHEQLISIRGLPQDSRSPVLIAGDALLKVFEQPEASFGNADGTRQSAGFSMQLAILLGRPVAEQLTTDVTALNTAAEGRKLVILVVSADDL